MGLAGVVQGARLVTKGWAAWAGGALKLSVRVKFKVMSGHLGLVGSHAWQMFASSKGKSAMVDYHQLVASLSLTRSY